MPKSINDHVETVGHAAVSSWFKNVYKEGIK